MNDFVTLTCPSCGGKLKITQDIESFACIHCGNEHIVRRGDGIVSLKPLVDSLSRIERHTSIAVDELKNFHLSEEIRRSEDAIRRYTLSSEKQRSKTMQLKMSLSALGRISFLENFSITSEAIVEKLLSLRADALASIVEFEARRLFSDRELLVKLQKHISLREKLGESSVPRDLITLRIGSPSKPMKRSMGLIFQGFGILLIIIALCLFFSPTLREERLMPLLFLALGGYLLYFGRVPKNKEI